MNEYRPEVGHHVRVVVEGRVTYTDAVGVLVQSDANGHCFGFDFASVAWTERLPDPEPEWQPGDVVWSAECGRAFTRTSSKSDLCWLDSIDGEVEPRRYLGDDLTLLVRDGKPVTR